MRQPEKKRFKFLRGQGGFSLIEVVFAVVIIGFIGGGVLKAIDTNARGGRVLDEQVQATNLVTAYLEAIRQLPYSDNASPYDSIGDDIAIPTQYSVNVTLLYSPDGTIWASTNNSGEYKLQKINILVLRTDGKPVLSACTFRTNR